MPTYLGCRVIHIGDNIGRMDKYVEAAAAELRAAQGRAKLTDTALAEKSGIPVVTLRRYLKGTRDTPTGAIFKIAAALGISPGRLLDDAMKNLDQL